MAKNGQNDLIFGKLVIFNDSKRPIGLFLKILIFGRFFAFFGPKTAIFFPYMEFSAIRGPKIGEKSKFSKFAQ